VSRKAYGSVEELQADRVDYVVISSKLVEQGYGPSPELYRWVKNHGKLVYGFVGRSFGLMGVYWIPEQVDQKGPTAARLSEAEYVDRVGEIQSSSVSDLLEIEQKIRRYDALTAADVKEIGAIRASLKGFTDEVDGLDPPQRYRAQYEVFRSAIREMYQASTVAYSLAADPISATQADFEAYQGHVDKAAAHLRSSNEMLGRHYRTVEAPRESGP
jgi:hypothetical protein